jgi:hypothetical protein
MAASLLGVGLLLIGTQARAQDAAPDREPSRILHFTKPAKTKPPAPTSAPAINASSYPMAVPPPARAVVPTSFQQPRMPAAPATGAPVDEGQEAQTLIQLSPPGPQRLFRLESESSLHERMRQEARERPAPERITFPEEPVVGLGQVVSRRFPHETMLVEPNYVCYGRLYFEEKNSERYGWDLGIIQPFLSASIFYWDLITLPYHMGTEPCRCYECSAGYCLPGDPVPYLLYPCELSLTGAIAEAATGAALFAIFP